MSHPLDTPVWNALTTGWSALAQGEGQALRLAPDYGPFAASRDPSPESLAALAKLDFAEDGLWFLQKESQPESPGTVVTVTAVCHQMVAGRVGGDNPAFEVAALGEADAPQMRALAALTRPGPFSTLTHRLGRFIGVRREGRLVAMAGERMRLLGFCEVSGVCTHPDFRGRGYAAGLMRLVTQNIQARGETAFLHTYADNVGAIALYNLLGFAHRETVMLTVLKRTPPG